MNERNFLQLHKKIFMEKPQLALYLMVLDWMILLLRPGMRQWDLLLPLLFSIMLEIVARVTE